MSRDDIIRMARKAGYTGLNDPWLHTFAALVAAALRDEMWEKAMKLVAEAAAAERERLARLAESQEDDAGYHSLSAAEIRAGRIGAEGKV
jgi:hypothetical protein